jgi:hypothetical protein
MSRKDKKPKLPVGPSKYEVAAKAERAVAWARVFERIVDKCGLTGAFLFFVCGFVVLYASPNQKRAIIDLFILGHGIHELYPTLLASLVFLALLLGQQYYYEKRIGKMEKELARLGEWKTNYQQSVISSPLHHSKEVGG